jgi:hypothetical protein
MGFWSKLGKIGSAVAPFALAPFTAGMSIPASMAISGSVGAGLGALGGGKKGALIGGLGGVGGAALSGSGALGKLGGKLGMGNQMANGADELAGSGGGGVLSKIFGKGGIDPTMAAMLGLSAIGGDDEGGGGSGKQYRNPGSSADPVQGLEEALRAIQRLGQGMQRRPGVSMRSSFVQPGAAPVSIPGIPFQIGGGMGTDPALKDPSLLQASGRNQTAMQEFDPFQSLAQGQFAAAKKPTQLRTS